MLDPMVMFLLPNSAVIIILTWYKCCSLILPLFPFLFVIYFINKLFIFYYCVFISRQWVLQFRVFYDVKHKRISFLHKWDVRQDLEHMKSKSKEWLKEKEKEIICRSKVSEQDEKCTRFFLKKNMFG